MARSAIACADPHGHGKHYITIFERGLPQLVTREVDHLYGTLYTDRMRTGQRSSRSASTAVQAALAVQQRTELV